LAVKVEITVLADGGETEAGETVLVEIKTVVYVRPGAVIVAVRSFV
jgi:hypothetical protein